MATVDLSARPRRGVTLALATVVCMLLAPAAATAGGDISTTGATTYRLDTAAGVVHVTTEVTLTNHKRPYTQGSYRITPYLDWYSVPHLGPAANVTAHTNVGGKQNVRIIDEGDGMSSLRVDLRPNLVHGTPQRLTVTYELPGQPARSDAKTRVNRAYATWFAYAPGDPGSADLTIDIPDTFELDLPAAKRTTTDGRARYHLTDLAADEQQRFISVRDDEQLTSRTVEVGPTTVTIRSWPDDDEWADFASDAVQRGLPALERIIGVPLSEDELTVLETAGQYHLGYAGLYYTDDATVEVGDRLDLDVMLHELAHAWFNGRLFTDRWITEGLAEHAAARALEELGEIHAPLAPTDPDKSAIKLNAWSQSTYLDGIDHDTELYAYNASHALMGALHDDIGDDGLHAVIAAATERHIAYQGDDDPETFRGDRDWRYFYDLADLVADSKAIDDLLADTVLTDNDAYLVTKRDAARSAYDDLAVAGEAWAPPYAVRSPMANWKFAEATDAIAEAHRLLAQADELRANYAVHGADPAAHLETTYEQASDLTVAATTFDQYADVADDLDRHVAQLETATVLQRIGLIGTDTADPAWAVAAINAGDVEQASTHLTAATATLDAAHARGTLRASATAGGLLALLAVASLLRRRRHRRTEATLPEDVAQLEA